VSSVAGFFYAQRSDNADCSVFASSLRGTHPFAPLRSARRRHSRLWRDGFAPLYRFRPGGRAGGRCRRIGARHAAGQRLAGRVARHVLCALRIRWCDRWRTRARWRCAAVSRRRPARAVVSHVAPARYGRCGAVASRRRTTRPDGRARRDGQHHADAIHRSDRAYPRLHRGGRYLSGQLHATTTLSRVWRSDGVLCGVARGTAGAVRRACASARWRLGAVAIARTVRRARWPRTSRRTSNEGHRAAFRGCRTGCARRETTGHRCQEPRRERDDRRPAAQRPRSRGDPRERGGARALRRRTVRSRVANDVDSHRDRAPGYVVRCVDGRAVPVRID